MILSATSEKWAASSGSTPELLCSDDLSFFSWSSTSLIVALFAKRNVKQDCKHLLIDPSTVHRLLDGVDKVTLNSETHSCWSNAFRVSTIPQQRLERLWARSAKFEWKACPVAQKEKKEAVETFKYIVLKKSILLPPICRGIFTLNHGTAKPFLTVLFEPNLYLVYA